MLRKIISVKNIGRFRNSAAPGNPDLSRHTLIVGANGLGKTTLCAVLRSLKTGDPDHILGRRTLGVEDPAIVEVLFPDGQMRFDGTSWSNTYPPLAIFDDTFVAENVHSGQMVEIDHRRNLYRVIIGEDGVSLAEEEATLAKHSREKTSKITATANAIQPHIPVGMKLDTFIALLPSPDIDMQIVEQQRSVEAARQAKQINDRPPLSEITFPTLPAGLMSLLARTIDDIARDAETRLAEHLAKHDMETDGGNWIAKGLEHAGGETCPFCGQNIQGLPLITAYRAVFSDRYKALRDEITAKRNYIIEQFGDGALGRINTQAEQIKGTINFWHRYCTFDPALLFVPEDIPDAIRLLGQAALALLERKDRMPLDPIQADAAFNAAVTTYDAAQGKVQELSEATRAVNTLIAAKKEETEAADLQATEDELIRRRAIKVRHTGPVAALCADHVRLTGEKDAINQRKDTVRAQLSAHSRRVMKPYEQRINHYLNVFNAGFRITEIRHGYPGGAAASTYQLVINRTSLNLGDERTPPDRASFKNTLSSGDRTTLALAFFLVHLEQDQNLDDKIVVFDDPFSSHDAFRRRQTVHEIAKVARSCAQVIVFSHDATFLKQVWDKAPTGERVALTLANHRRQGTKITPIDLKRACQGRTATDMDDLLTYVNTGSGNPLDLIRKMRLVLETHCWTTYPASFQPSQDWLGDIVRKIREGGNQHPAADLYDELDQINDYTSEHHHGENMADAMTDQIDSQELTGYIKRTLRIVNALQA